MIKELDILPVLNSAFKEHKKEEFVDTLLSENQDKFPGVAPEDLKTVIGNTLNYFVDSMDYGTPKFSPAGAKNAEALGWMKIHPNDPEIPILLQHGVDTYHRLIKFLNTETRDDSYVLKKLHYFQKKTNWGVDYLFNVKTIIMTNKPELEKIYQTVSTDQLYTEVQELPGDLHHLKVGKPNYKAAVVLGLIKTRDEKKGTYEFTDKGRDLRQKCLLAL